MESASEPVARVFFALVPPASLRQASASLGRDIAKRARGRAVPAENLHVTVAFVGAWPLSAAVAVDRRRRALCRRGRCT